MRPKPTPSQSRIALGSMTLLFVFGSRLFSADIAEARRSLSWPNTTGTILRSETKPAYKSVTTSNRHQGDRDWVRDLVTQAYPPGAIAAALW